MNRNRKRNISRLVAVSACAAMTLSMAGSAFAQEDWGEYNIENDGFGYLTANFPALFTSDFILYENETSTAQQVEAIMYTITDEEKDSLLSADGYWAGIARMGIPEVKAASEDESDTSLPAPGAYAAAATFSEEAASLYGAAAATQTRQAEANLMPVSSDQFGQEGILSQTQSGAVSEAALAGGVITGLTRKIGIEGDVSALSDEEKDEAVTDRLTAIGRAGYLGMVQKSRDGLAALDDVAPEDIALSVELDEEAEADAQEVMTDTALAGAVLLKNEDQTLPLAQEADYSAVNGADSALVETDGVSVIYATGVEDDQADELDEQFAAAQDAGQKIVLVLATDEPVNIDAWADQADAVLEVWSPVEDEAAVLSALLSGDVNPSGKLPAVWPTDSAESEWGFGYGLSYTTFSYEITDAQLAAADDDAYGIDVTVDVTNTGDQDGASAVQVYLDGEDGAQLAAYGKTDVIGAGESAQMTVHIFQNALSATDENGEESVTEGTVTLFTGADGSDQAATCDVEVKAAVAGASVEATAPESVTAGEAFDVTISTPVDVITLTLTDADGNAYQPVDVLKQNQGDSITFTYTLQIDTAGTAVINVLPTTKDGPATEPAAAVEVQVQ